MDGDRLWCEHCDRPYFRNESTAGDSDLYCSQQCQNIEYAPADQPADADHPEADAKAT